VGGTPDQRLFRAVSAHPVTSYPIPFVNTAGDQCEKLPRGPHLEIRGLLGGNLHPGAHLHGSGGSIQPRFRNLLPQRPQATYHQVPIFYDDSHVGFTML